MIHRSEELEQDRKKLNEALATEWLAIERDICYYASLCKTHDPHGPSGQKIRPYPIIEKPYLGRLLQYAHKLNKLAIYKSRQILVTWSMLVEVSHHGLFTPGAYVALLSKKEEDAGKLIGKIKVLYDHLPMHVRYLMPEMQYYKGRKGVDLKLVIRHEEHESIIQAYPEGMDQSRMDTYSLVYWDEVGFFDDYLARQTYASLVPTLEGGGRLLMSSTPPRDPEHFWNQLVSGVLFD